MAGLTLAPEGSGLLAKLLPIYIHLHLRSRSHRGCRMSENEGDLYLITKGKTVVAKGLVFYISTYIDTCWPLL